MRLLKRLPIYAAGGGFAAAVVAVAEARHWSGVRTLLVALAVGVFYVVTILVPWLIREQIVPRFTATTVEAETSVTWTESNGHGRAVSLSMKVRGANGALISQGEDVPETRGLATIGHSEPHVAVRQSPTVRPECAVLCDAASIREGLLNILGGGVTNVVIQLPAALPLTFAVRVVLEPHEIRSQHIIRLQLLDQMEKPKGAVEVTLTVADPEQYVEETALVQPVPLGGLQIEKPGRYFLEARLDEHVLGTFPFRVEAAKGQGWVE